MQEMAAETVSPSSSRQGSWSRSKNLLLLYQRTRGRPVQPHPDLVGLLDKPVLRQHLPETALRSLAAPTASARVPRRGGDLVLVASPGCSTAWIVRVPR